jgi:hypothetical protein
MLLLLPSYTVGTRHDAGAQYDSDSMPALQRYAVVGSNHWCRCRHCRRCRKHRRAAQGAIAGGEERAGEGELLQVEGSNCRWRGAIAGGGERSQVEGSDRRWRGVIAGGAEQQQVEGTQGSNCK